MDDFAGEAVKRFLGALYSGEILLEKDLFRDVNKLCHVFKVEWLAGRCGDYFTSLVGEVSLSSDYQTLLFLFEEARFCSRVMKCNKFLDLVLVKICSLENRAEIFVEPYMRNYCELETSQLDLMLQITRRNPVFLLKIMKKNLESKGKIFDEASRYLLQNVDLCKCISEDEGLLLCDLTPDIVHEMEIIRCKNGWSRISPEFLESCSPRATVNADTIKEHGSDLTSKEESVRRVGKVVGPKKKDIKL